MFKVGLKPDLKPNLVCIVKKLVKEINVRLKKFLKSLFKYNVDGINDIRKNYPKIVPKYRCFVSKE